MQTCARSSARTRRSSPSSSRCAPHSPGGGGALEHAASVSARDVATIIYTSGTSGPPKGCVVTHSSLLATVAMYQGRLELAPPLTVYLYLPLAHSLARVTQLAVLDAGGMLAFCGGDPKRMVALITLDPDEAPKLAAELGIPADIPAMARDPRVHAAIGEDIETVNGQFARIEQIKRFEILERDLTQADDELTPTLKVKRGVVYERFADRVEALYAQ